LLGASSSRSIRHKPGELSFISKNSAVVALLTTSDASDYVDFAGVALQHASFLEERW